MVYRRLQYKRWSPPDLQFVLGPNISAYMVQFTYWSLHWAAKVNELQHISDRIVIFELIICSSNLPFTSVYAPQVDRPEPEKQQFYDELHYSVENLPATEILIPIGDWNSHGGAPAGVVSDAHAGRGFITCYTEGERFLEFAMPKGLRVGNTWFKKGDTHLIAYSFRGEST